MRLIRSIALLLFVSSGLVGRSWSATDSAPLRLGSGVPEASQPSGEAAVETTSVPFAPPPGIPSYAAAKSDPDDRESDDAKFDNAKSDEVRGLSLDAASTLKSTPTDESGTLRPFSWTGNAANPTERSSVSNAFAPANDTDSGVYRIPSFVLSSSASSHRIVRYEVPLSDPDWHQKFAKHGVQGRLIEVVDESEIRDQTFGERMRRFISPTARRRELEKVRLVRYEVSAEDIGFHAELTDLDGQMIELGLLRLPEVRFFQPKARVYMDLKRRNDDEFDLFSNGSILASLDVVELYFPMPLISERFAEVFGRPGRLASLGWRVGGTLGLGITTALNNGTVGNGSSPVTTLSSGIRYEFPLGRPSIDVIETGDPRLDERTRVGMEFGIQGGVSTRESLDDATDVGVYFGVLVSTPWGT